jgi:DNA-binding response OmpR family regulator
MEAVKVEGSARPIPPVFLVEHDAPLRDSIASALRDDGHHVLEFADGMQLLAHVLLLLRQPGVSFAILADTLAPSVAEVMDMLRGSHAREVAATAVFTPPVAIAELRTVANRLAMRGSEVTD